MAQWHGSLVFPLSTTGNSERRTAEEYDHSTATHRRIDTDFGSESKATVQTVQMRGCAAAVSKVRGVHSVRPC